MYMSYCRVGLVGRLHTRVNELPAKGPWFVIAGLYGEICGKVLQTISSLVQCRSSLNNVRMLRRTGGSWLTQWGRRM